MRDLCAREISSVSYLSSTVLVVDSDGNDVIRNVSDPRLVGFAGDLNRTLIDPPEVAGDLNTVRCVVGAWASGRLDFNEPSTTQFSYVTGHSVSVSCAVCLRVVCKTMLLETTESSVVFCVEVRPHTVCDAEEPWLALHVAVVPETGVDSVSIRSDHRRQLDDVLL